MNYKLIHKILSLFLCGALLLGSLPWVRSVEPALAAEVTAAETAASADDFAVHFIDVGQADAALILCDGEAMLIDGGNVADSNVIYTYLRNQGVTHLKYVVATHPHEDHVGGLAGALNYATVDTVFCSTTTFSTEAFKDFVKAVNNRGKSITIPTVGRTFTLGRAVCTVLAVNTESTDVNNTSIVLRVVFGETSFLFTGDAEQPVEQAMIEQGKPLSSTVLKVGHHGSGSSTSYAFLWHVMPQYAVISCEQGNKYGHPHDAPLSRLRDAGVKLFRTDKQGDVVCHSDGSKVSFTVSRNANADVYEEVGGSRPEVTEPEVTLPDATEWEYVTSVETGKPYILGMNTAGTQRYFSGTTESASVSFRLASTTDAKEAVTVYLEAVSGVAGAYRMYFIKNGVKCYIRTYEYTDGTAGKGKGSMALTTEVPAEYYTFQASADTLVYKADGDNSYHIGAYNSYTTFSASNTYYITGSNASKVDVSQFPARLYTAVAVEEPETEEPETEEPENEEPQSGSHDGFGYIVSDGKILIIGYTGAEENLTIPETIAGYPVAAIGDRAFYCNSMLRSVVIPASVATVGVNAFASCANLTSVTLCDGVASIGNRAFFYCAALNDIAIPASVTAIGDSAFAGCENLQTVGYAGSPAQWQSMALGTNNESLLNATVLFGTNDVVEQWSVSLEDDLKATFHVRMEKDDQVKISVGDAETVLQASQLEQTQSGAYIATVELAAAQMTESIRLQRISGAEVSDMAIYSVRQYADVVLADENYSRYHAVVKEMLNYGGCAQVYFDHAVHDLANEGLSDVGTAEIPKQTETEIVMTGKATGISFYGASLYYRDKVALRFYFRTEADIETYLFSAGSAVQSGDGYYVEIPNIMPEELDQPISLAVTDSAGGTFTVTYSPMHYMVRMNVKGSEQLQWLLKALYNYHLAAKALRSN